MIRHSYHLRVMAVRNRSSFISTCSWNVGGLISKTYNKLNDVNFIQEILPYDLVCLSETHIGYDSTVYIEGFQYIRFVGLFQRIIDIMVA